MLLPLIDTSDPAVVPYHNAVAFTKPFDAVASAAVTNLSAVFLNPDADAAAFEATWNQILAASGGSVPDGFVAGTHGWALEPASHPKIEGKAKVFVAASGWESIEKHQATHEGMKAMFAYLGSFTSVVETVGSPVELSLSLELTYNLAPNHV